MKNKNGFTLIELLVTIALILSILGITVVSLINVSNKKKKESWQQVKGQIETAAVEYFTANEYLFEGLKSGSSGTISVGKLVSEDYLNKVTNPYTGKAVSMCAMVNITKENKKYSALFDESSEKSSKTNCESNNNNIITISEPGAPEFNITDTCENKSGDSISPQNGYCYRKTFGVNVTKANGKIISKKYCVGMGASCGVTKDFTDLFDGADKTVKDGIVGITLTNQSGAKATKYKGYKIDRTAPVITENNIKSENSGYNTLKPNISVRAKDDESGIDYILSSSNGNDKRTNSTSTLYSFTIANDYDTIHNLKVTAVAYDKVGNSSNPNENSYSTYLKCSQKTTTVKTGEYGSCSAACGGGEHTRTDTTNVKDKYISGVSCPGDGATNNVTKECNKQSCCSKTKETGKVNWGSWSSECNSSDERTRKGTKNLVSAYDSSVSCGTTTKYDSKSCDLTPKIDKVQFRYNKSKCPNGWVEIRYSGINMAKYTAYFKYSHTVQGTTATASTLKKDFKSLTETFCRGYGSSQKNVMKFEVTFKNKSSNKTNKYSGKCIYSKMFNSNNSYNSEWHDCSMN